jgi:hypothetical protein
MPQIRAKRFNISDVIMDICGHKVLEFDINDSLQQQMIVILKKALAHIASKDNIFHARRPNDISDNTKDECLEDRIEKYFNEIKDSAKARITAKRLKEKGYPNLVTFQDGAVVAYLEVKVKSTTRRSESSARDFYISPGTVIKGRSTISSQEIVYKFDIYRGNTSRKIQADAPHLLILCKAEDLGSSERYSGYRLWKLLEYSIFDLSKLNLKLKIEFNANYRDIERECSLV